MSSVGGERKIATMVFADLVGSTKLAGGLDPEELRARLEPFFEAASSALEQYGGTVEKYIGDAVMAVFGAPVAHGDDPDRAVAAGMAVVEKVGALDGDLAVRVGIETGEVLAVPETSDLSVTGEAVNAAARLQQAAAAGEVLVGARAARSCRRARLERREAITAKGIEEPLTPFRAVAVDADPELSGAPLVGREDDLEMLRLIARRAARERSPQLVMVIGEAGIGKSRLSGELFSELRSEQEGWRTVVGRSPPYGHGISFWALGEILRDAAGTSTDAPADEVAPALQTLLEDLGAKDAPRLASALTVAIRGADGDLNPGDDLKQAWRRFVALLAAERPLAIGVDDAHWADEGMLELVEDAAFGLHDAPVLILCTSRPELTERRPEFGRAARNITQIELPPLDADAAQRLAEELLPEGRPAIAARIAAAAGGNPFFTEEVICSITDEGDESAAERLPDTVQAAIAARMDQLPPEEKRTLQYAAVLGHTFSQGPLGDLLGESPSEALWGLRRKALIADRAGSESGHYIFRHQLIRDVAYNSLPRGERARLHEEAAEALLSREPFAELPELVAYHLTHACELDSTPERGRAARDAVLKAAETAVRRGAAARGQELYEEAAGLSADDAERLDSLQAAAEVALRGWRGDHALRLFREAGEAGERAGEPARAAGAYARAVEVGGRMHGISGDPPEAELEPLLNRGRELAAEDDLVTLARLKLDEAWMAWLGQRGAAMVRPAREGLELARNTDDLQLLQSAMDAVTASDWLEGRQQDAVAHTRERLELLESAPRTHALDVELSDALHMIVLCLLQTGEFREAADYARRGAAIDRSRGVELAAYHRGLMPAFFMGEWDQALEMANGAREAWLAADKPPMGAFATEAACAGAIYGYRGDEASAEDWMAHADLLVPGDTTEQASGVRLLAADMDLHHGRLDDAASRTVGSAGGTQWHAPYSATRAEAFVRAGRADAAEAIEEAQTRVGEHRYAIGVLLRARGVHGDDEGLLRESLELFEEIKCPYQAARTAWLLGGEARDGAKRTLTELGATEPAG